MDNFLFKYNLQITFQSPTLWHQDNLFCLIKIRQDNLNRIVLPKCSWINCQDNQSLSYRRNQVACKTFVDCLTEWYLSDRSCIACKTIDCLTEGMPARQFLSLSRQSLIVWPKMHCQDNWIVWPKEQSCQGNIIVLPKFWIVLLALKLSFCCVLCLQGNLKLSCPFHFVFATYNCLVFQLSYKYKCFAYKYGIASFIFSVHHFVNQSICKAFKLFVTCLIVISTVFCALITRLF